MNLSEFRDWSLAQGQVGKYDDGQYVGQCVSLVNQYCYRVLDVPAGAWGHAYAWANDNNPNRAYFDKVSSIQAGDVIVYGTNFTPSYGHIGIALGNGQLLDQNGHSSLHVATGGLYNGYAAVLRKKGGSVNSPDTNKPDRDWVTAFVIQMWGYNPWDPASLDPGKQDFLNKTYREIINTSGADPEVYWNKVNAGKLVPPGNYELVTDKLYKKK
jgi:hypothetical protein